MFEFSSERLRIAAFISHPIQYFAPLWRELGSRPGVQLRVFYFSRSGLEASNDAGFGTSFAWDIDLLGGYESEFLPRQWPTRDPLDPTPLAVNSGLIRALRKGWDAVFINGYAHLNNWLLISAAQALGLPVLCFADSNLLAERGKRALKLAAKRAFLRQFLPRVTAFLAAGGSTRRYLEHYGVRQQDIFICPYAVDIGRFEARVRSAGAVGQAELRARWGITADRRIVMFCGKLVSWKRPLDVVEAIKRLNDPNVVAVFVGEGPLKAALKHAGDPNQVFTVGFVNQTDIPLALSLADALVLSSEYEPYGMVVSEAQSLGVPAVVSDACGCYGPESVLEDGVSGFVYPTGNISALSDRLHRILHEPGLLGRMRAAARGRGATQSQVAAADGFLAAVRHAVGVPRRG
ncbi:MAG TPA: glycosyltransferase family 4 protein [Polyangiales bacterium]|nr:glycosyltransferase family 4 protein [Polyangiales bacterium]